MLRHGDRNLPLDRLVISLALIAMVMCMQNPVDFADA
jgi:hypothetical protein